MTGLRVTRFPRIVEARRASSRDGRQHVKQRYNRYSMNYLPFRCCLCYNFAGSRCGNAWQTATAKEYLSFTRRPPIRLLRRLGDTKVGRKKTSKRVSRQAPAVEISTPDGPIVAHRDRSERRRLQELAMRWQYRMENRERWATLSRSVERLREEAREALGEWGFDRDSLAALAEARIAEVQIPAGQISEDAQDDSWEARIFPWEFILTAATKTVRDGRPLTVVRHLIRPADHPSPLSELNRPQLAIVESSPGPLHDEFDFSRERRLIAASCQSGGNYVQICNPTADTLQAELKRAHPGIVHISAVDTRLALERLSMSEFSEDDLPRFQRAVQRRGKRDGDMAASVEENSTTRLNSWRNEGIVLGGVNGRRVDAVPPAELAALLTVGDPPPAFVGFNVWHSAARMAPLTVASGAASAIGFQTVFDDGLAELFFATFYETWRNGAWKDLLEAFEAAWRSLRDEPGELTGTGVVLWSAASLIQPKGTMRMLAGKSLAEKKAAARAAEPLDVETARTNVEISVKPIRRLNYSLLHNNRPFFETFRIRKFAAGTLRDVRVEVELHVGGDSYPYRATFDLDKPLKDMAPEIRLPLTSALIRQVDENMRTNLYVRVAHEHVVLHEQSYPITLLPVDLWKDTDDDRQWLPSFVLPRDPAVTRVIQNAQGHLACLADNAAVGFDGYQAVDLESADPYLGVDMQVRAIWTALVLSLPLNYINPPPSYEPQSQRLRTPTQILESGRGTCIDLSLLLASCLEFVEIYPVLFLLEGHAFPGYWRSEEGYEAFLAVSDSAGEAELTRASGADGFPWSVGRNGYREVMDHVRQGHLLPLESTLLAERGGFQNAIDVGCENLRYKREFHSLLDVRLARINESNPVTPLPLENKR